MYQSKENDYQSSELTRSSDLPSLINSPYPYLAVGDLSRVVQRIVPSANGNVRPYQEKLLSLLEINAPEKATFYSTSSEDIDKKIKQIVTSEINRSDRSIGIANLDRYLCGDLSSDKIFQLNISRNIDGGLVARPGTITTPEEQISSLVEWAKTNNIEELIVLDDVLAFGDTMVPLIQQLQAELPDTEIRAIVGIASSGGAWSGIEKVQEGTGITPESIITVMASPETEWSSGMAVPTSRDFTFLGGKIFQTPEAPISFPYFLPFSIPVASFMPKENRIDSARKLIRLNIKLANFVSEELGRDLTISDLISAGFGIPYTKIEGLTNVMDMASLDTPVVDYLEYAEAILEENIDLIEMEIQKT